ncbi:HTH domain-containing protein [Streptomyces sp. NPDC050988]|uniref:HTH domain-containing protein n=1 Tax=Streptomyces sp. NPDC050988 TaxID=3365637 RepID=UPI0037937DF8
MTRTDRLTLVRQLSEEGLSQRTIAKRLNVSKDTVRRDLDRISAQGEPDDAPPAEPDDQGAPQVSGGDAEGGAPVDAPQGAPVAPLPRRMTGPLALPDGFDLRQWPAVRRDLATLAQSGLPVEKLVHDAITSVAHHYRQALAVGDIEVGQSFTVSHVALRPLPVARRTGQAG